MKNKSITLGLMIGIIFVSFAFGVGTASAKTSEKKPEIADEEDEEGSGKAEDGSYSEEGIGTSGDSGSSSDPCTTQKSCSCNEETGIFTCEGKECGGCSVTEGKRNTKGGQSSGPGGSNLPSSGSSGSGSIHSGGSGGSGTTKTGSELDEYMDSASKELEDVEQNNFAKCDDIDMAKYCLKCNDKIIEVCVFGNDQVANDIYTMDGSFEIFGFWRDLFNSSGATGCSGTAEHGDSAQTRVCLNIYSIAVEAYTIYLNCNLDAHDRFRKCVDTCNADPNNPKNKSEGDSCKDF